MSRIPLATDLVPIPRYLLEVLVRSLRGKGRQQILTEPEYMALQEAQELLNQPVDD